MAENYYIILGLSSNASDEDIRTAYRRLAKEYHPDHYGEDSEPFLRIQEAYGVLSDPDSRRNYDKSIQRASQREPFRDVTEETLRRHRRVEPIEPAMQRIPVVSLSRSFQTFHPSFDEIFDRLWSNRPKSETRLPLTAEIVLSPEDARLGGQVRVFVPAGAPCHTCRGRGGMGPWQCRRCAGEGSIRGEFPIMIEYPMGIRDGHTAMVALDKLGSKNLCLTLRFRILRSHIWD